MEAKLQRLQQLLGEIDSLRKIGGVLGWDQQTCMPASGSETRARQIAILQELTHARFVSDEIGELLDDLRPLAEQLDYASETTSLIRLTARDYEKARKIPDDFVAEFARKTSLAQDIWYQAKQAKNFAMFQPILTELVELSRQEAEMLGYTDHIYDALLDTHEPEMKTAEVVTIFDELKAELSPLLRQVVAHQDRVQDTIFHGEFDPDAQWRFGLEVVKQLGYNLNRGRVDKSAHPFTVGISRNDVRITTRLDPQYVLSGLSHTIHECGHALHGQGFPEDFEGTTLDRSASKAVSESQSLFWEFMIGRSQAFWAYLLPKLKQFFPAQFADATVAQAYQGVNIAKPGYIRLDAGELTYNFHIFLRFELEVALISGELEVKDLPAAWNQKMQTYLDLTPPDDAAGVLQDAHWSHASFGYFPTYTLGNVLAAQLYACIEREIPDVTGHIERGEFAPILQWLREHIHAHGAKFPPQELIRRASGEPLTAKPYIAYMNKKYRELYGIA